MKLSLQRTLLTSAAALLICSGLVSGQRSADAMTRKRMAVVCHNITQVSHRGEVGYYGKKHHDENTLSAFYGAVRRGADELETDLRRTSDGVWVLMHDNTVDRTTNGSGKVNAMTFDQLRQLRTTHGYKVPALQGLFGAFVANPAVSFQLELKEPNVGPKKLQELIDTVNNRGLHDRVMFTSVHGTNLLRIKDIDPTIKTGLISSGTNKASIKTLKSYNVDATMVHYLVATPSFVSNMHSHGFKVSSRSTTNATQFTKTVNAKTDRVVTDYTKRYNTWCNNL